MLINPYCADLGWLFEDVKRLFGRLDGYIGPDSVTPSETPLSEVASWICIRSWETRSSPSPSRTVVQIHSLDPRLILGTEDPDAVAKAIHNCGGLVFTHPKQPVILRELGIAVANKRCLLRPIGALDIFTEREELSPMPTFAWVGRDTGSKRTHLFTEAAMLAAQTTDISVEFVGANLDKHFVAAAPIVKNAVLHDRKVTPIEDYPRIYQRCDAVVITSELEAGPMCLYEALASGVPVITTRCGWAEHPIQEGVNGYIVEESKHMAEDIAHRMLDIASHRSDWFEQRHLIRASLMGWSMESWIEDNVRLAIEVASGE